MCEVALAYQCFFFIFLLLLWLVLLRPTCQHQSTWGSLPPDKFFVKRRFHSRESNRQPLPWNLGISPPSSSSLGSSRTTYQWFPLLLSTYRIRNLLALILHIEQTKAHNSRLLRADSLYVPVNFNFGRQSKVLPDRFIYSYYT